MFRIDRTDECDDGEVFGQRHSRRRCQILIRFPCLRVFVDDFHISGTRPGLNLLKDKFTSAWNLLQSQILRRRANENQVVVFCVVQRKKASSLNPQGLVECSENQIQIVNRKNLSDASVMIKNRTLSILGGVVIPHARIGASDEGGIAENDPRFFGTRGKTSPEDTNWRRGRYRPSR